MRTAVVLGGNGLVGRAVAARLLDEGWSVTTTGRSAQRVPAGLRDRGVRFVTADRRAAGGMRAALAGGADAVVDCVGYTAADARLLLGHAGDVATIVFVSSKAVYVDDRGRHSNSADPPDFGGPVDEARPTLAPREDLAFDTAEGYGPNKVAAERTLLDSGVPVSVLRPSRIHGAGAARSREWYLVRRILNRRPRVLLAHRGRGANHPTSAANLAALAAWCAAHPGDRVLNSADPDAPDGLAVTRAVAAHLGHDWDEVLLPDDAPAGLGRHPWDTVPPFLLDTSAAERLGYVPVGTYAQTVVPALDELVADGAPGDSDWFAGMFDYAAEDAWQGRDPRAKRPGRT